MEVQDRNPRILITRLSAIGDSILTLPVLTTLRRKIPNAYIAWAIEPPTDQFLQLHPDLDDVIRKPRGWYKSPGGWIQMSRRLKQYQFDVVIDPQGITKSSTLGWLSGAKQRIGLKGKWGREISPWLNNELVLPKSRHIVKRSVELLKPLGINVDLDELEFGLPVCQSSAAQIATKLAEMELGGRFCVINPGGGWPSRQWEMERWGSVASYLKRHHQLPSVIVWAGNEELEMAKAIHDFDPTASKIAPSTSLLELAALARRCSFFLSGDTGPMHIASAMGTPVVGLYGSTHPEDSGAYGKQHIHIQKWHQTGNRRKAENDAMRDIVAGEVFAACDQMIGRIKTKAVA